MSRGLTLGQASKVALSIHNQRDNVVVKCNVNNVRTYKAKSNIGEGEIYMADFILSDTHKDTQGDAIPQSTLLQPIAGMEADLEHIDICPDVAEFGISDERLFTVVKEFYSEDKKMATVKFNPDHPNFLAKDGVWDACRKGAFGISLVFNKALDMIKGISGTMDPVNTRAKIINAYQL